MKSTLILLVVTMLASFTMSAGVPFQEQQYRAKYGRYSPAYEAKLKTEQATMAPIQIENAVPDCCRILQAGKVDFAEERNRVKYGRYSPAKEAEVQAAQLALLKHAQACRALESCPLPTATQPTVTTLSNRDARSIAKYGRVFPAMKATVAVVTAKHIEACEHACCQDTE